ncbi:MAG: hypothetical protein JXQ76_02370 [Campylobacterales bacterium]|nr:hypothetical protein [Campylobacterales bacterium]
MRVWIVLALLLQIILADQLRNEVRDGYTPPPKSNIKSEHINSNGVNITLRYPASVYAGEYFTIYASMTNNIDYAKMGGLTLSFPQYNSMDADILSRRFDKLNGYLPPSKLYSRVFNRNIAIDYYVIEGWENGWSYGATKHMELKFKAPFSIPQIDINVRGVLVFGKGRNKQEVAVPLNSYLNDQQGYPVRQINIEVLK